MKKCTKCKISKALSDFHSDKSRRDSLAFWCRSCQKNARDARPPRVSSESRKAYKRAYAANRLRTNPVVRERLAAQRATRKKIVDDFKRDRPCTDCGNVHSPFVMDFDHRDPSTKVANISRMIEGAAIASLIEEITKCDLVCANCHRYRTFGGSRETDDLLRHEGFVHGFVAERAPKTPRATLLVLKEAEHAWSAHVAAREAVAK